MTDQAQGQRATIGAPISDPGQFTNERAASCHCGTVRFTVRVPEELNGGRCTCSICAMKGAVMIGVPLDAVEVTAGEDSLTCYRFNTGEARHYFCATCGIHCFHQRRSFPDQYAVNAACIEGVSPYDFAEVTVIDGVNHPNDTHGTWRVAGTLRFEASEG
jgi:hypothetical protein